MNRVLVVFAKAPRPGRVKTRLARALGDEEAARLYRRMGRAIVDGLRDGDWQMVVRFAPDNAADELRSWLGDEALELLPQGPGDLGTRMERGIAEAFHAFGPDARVCVVGTDTPEVDAELVDEAFRRLETGSDVVLGPAVDGGYYLIGLAAPRPMLFRDIAWSTPSVLPRTRERIRDAGLRVSELHPLNDVDEIDDLDGRRI